MRRWLAKMICPEAFKEAEDAESRLWYVHNRLDELRQWCGYGFPEIRAAVDWVQKSERIHFMSLDAYDAEVAKATETKDWSLLMVGGIDKFRDQISDQFDRRPERVAP